MLEVIIPAYMPVLHILGKNKIHGINDRFSTFCKRVETDDAVLYLNTLTCELVRCFPEDEPSKQVQNYLRSNWYIVPKETDDIHLADQVRSLLTLMSPKSGEMKSFTVFTTTDCNARCFYCFENGCGKIDMTPDTADGVAAFILGSIPKFPTTLILMRIIVRVLSLHLREKIVILKTRFAHKPMLF